jgi:hypothetical protein
MDCLLDEPGSVVSLETSDNSLVIWLNMCSEAWLEVFDRDCFEVRGNNMAGEVVLKE